MQLTTTEDGEKFSARSYRAAHSSRLTVSTASTIFDTSKPATTCAPASMVSGRSVVIRRLTQGTLVEQRLFRAVPESDRTQQQFASILLKSKKPNASTTSTAFATWIPFICSLCAGASDR